jgi:hypothetical protein
MLIAATLTAMLSMIASLSSAIGESVSRQPVLLAWLSSLVPFEATLFDLAHLVGLIRPLDGQGRPLGVE